MRAVTAKAFGEPEDVLEMQEAWPKPKAEKKGEMLVRVEACSVTPGDYRMMVGEGSLLKKPAKFPYVPGLDVCGVVEQAGPEAKFKVGDRVISSWAGIFGVGGMAEYAVVTPERTVLAPEGMRATEAACLSNSAMHALKAFEQGAVKPGDRVLVIGASGGVGSVLVQLAKNAGASFVAGSSTAEALVKELGADVVINHKDKSWAAEPSFREQPFDVIFDAAEGSKAWQAACKNKVLKPRSGRFVAIVPREWVIIMRHSWHVATWFTPVLGRVLFNKVNIGAPIYSLYLGGYNAGDMQRVLDMVAAGKLRVAIDAASPLPFTLAGVKQAFRQLGDRAGHGKIVVDMSMGVAGGSGDTTLPAAT